MIKIKQLSDVAVWTHGKWYSENRAFADVLNSAATPENVIGYYTDIQEAIIQIVEGLYKNIEVVEITKDIHEPIFEDPIY